MTGTPFTFAEQTDALVERSASEALLAISEANGLPMPDTLLWATSVMVDGCLPTDCDLDGQKAQALSAWHTQMKDQCSAAYKAIRESQPNASRKELNANPELLSLNAVRLGVRKAMQSKYSLAPRK